MKHTFRSKLNKSNYKTYGSVRICAAAVILYFFAFGTYQLYFSEVGQQPRINATVLENREIVMGRGTENEQKIYTPLLEYEVDGETYTTNTGVRAISNPYRVGQQVEIRYEPGNPESIYQSNISRLYATYMFVLLFGVTGVALLSTTIIQMRTIHSNTHSRQVSSKYRKT